MTVRFADKWPVVFAGFWPASGDAGAAVCRCGGWRSVLFRSSGTVVAGGRSWGRGGGVADADAVGTDAELAGDQVVAAGPGLDDGQGPGHGAVVAVVAEDDRVVGQVGEGEL